MRPTPSLKVDARNVAGPNQLQILKAHDSLSAGKGRPPQDFQVSVVNPRSEGAWCLSLQIRGIMTCRPPSRDPIQRPMSPLATFRTPVHDKKRSREAGEGVGDATDAPGAVSRALCTSEMAAASGTTSHVNLGGGCDSAHKAPASPMPSGSHKRQRPSSPVYEEAADFCPRNPGRRGLDHRRWLGTEGRTPR